MLTRRRLLAGAAAIAAALAAPLKRVAAAPAARVFEDSPEKAVRDAAITNLHYRDGEFRRFFTTPFEEQAKYVGRPFTVVRQTQEIDVDEEQEDMYLIRFDDDGDTLEAFGHEVCVLDYDKCVPKFVD